MLKTMPKGKKSRINNVKKMSKGKNQGYTMLKTMSKGKKFKDKQNVKKKHSRNIQG